MELEKAISTEPIKEKLKNLEKYMPEEEDTIYRFGEFLADRLNQQLNPLGFNMAAELTLYDLQRGIDGFSGQPIRNSLVGYPPMIYFLLRMRVPDIAKAVCPEDFAMEVENFQKEVDAKLKK